MFLDFMFSVCKLDIVLDNLDFNVNFFWIRFWFFIKREFDMDMVVDVVLLLELIRYVVLGNLDFFVVDNVGGVNFVFKNFVNFLLLLVLDLFLWSFLYFDYNWLIVILVDVGL